MGECVCGVGGSGGSSRLILPHVGLSTGRGFLRSSGRCCCSQWQQAAGETSAPCREIALTAYKRRHSCSRVQNHAETQPRRTEELEPQSHYTIPIVLGL